MLRKRNRDGFIRYVNVKTFKRYVNVNNDINWNVFQLVRFVWVCETCLVRSVRLGLWNVFA